MEEGSCLTKDSPVVSPSDWEAVFVFDSDSQVYQSQNANSWIEIY